MDDDRDDIGDISASMKVVECDPDTAHVVDSNTHQRKSISAMAHASTDTKKVERVTSEGDGESGGGRGASG